MRTVTVEENDTITQTPSFHLNAKQRIVFFDYRVIPVVLTKWDRYKITRRD